MWVALAMKPTIKRSAVRHPIGHGRTDCRRDHLNYGRTLCYPGAAARGRSGPPVRVHQRGDFEEAYALFAEQSRREVSLAQYSTFFEDNAPYSVTDYSFSPPEIEGDSASLEAEFTVTSASGVERLERTQEFVREGGYWRVVMRPDQVSAFTVTDGAAEAEPVPEPDTEAGAELEPAPQPKPKTKSRPKTKSPEPPPAPAATGSSATPPVGGDCPDEAPIKGNASSGIYHVPGGEFYNRTNAEECFASESAAQDAGYRASQV